MSNLTQRLITGTIFVIVLVGCIWWSAVSFALLAVLITVLGLSEFYRLSEKAGAQPLRYYSVGVGALMIFLAYAAKTIPEPSLLLFIIPLLFLIFFIELFRKRTNPFGNISWSIIGLIYIAVPLTLMVYTFIPTKYVTDAYIPASFTEHYNPIPVLTFFILIWVSDSLAYVCGRLFGKHKLWERISPKKTWEGFIGGLLFTVATGFCIGYFAISDRVLNTGILWAIIGLTISITGMLGDLVESLFKRSIDVKDSGTILPGHGGILDRFDALFLSVPFAITVYWVFGSILN
jgi:phosphatidate cytidylyltransferase